MLSLISKINIGTRLTISYLSIAFLVAIVGFFSFSELTKVLVPLTDDIPKNLAQIERMAQLDGLAQKIRLYDQTLTESSRDYVYEGSRSKKLRYAEFERRLESAIDEAIEKGDARDTGTFIELRQKKRVFVDMEYKAIRTVDEGDKSGAIDILESKEYWQNKRLYKKSLNEYVERRGQAYGQSLEVTAEKVKAIIEHTHSVVNESLSLLLKISLLAVCLAIFLGLYVSRTIVTPIRKLQKGAKIIGKGFLNQRIEIDSQDELGELAEAFNQMSVKLKESYAGLEEKVLEKTSELAKKVEEIEEEKAKDQAILTSIGEGMIATDPDGRIMMMNPQAAILLGVNSEEMIGEMYYEKIGHCTQEHAKIALKKIPMALCLAHKRRVLVTSRYVRSNGTDFPASVTVSPVVRDGHLIGAIEIFRDVTKEKEIDRMKTEFVSTVSHELRTPLTVIREGVSLVLEKVLGPVTKDQDNFLQMALKDIDRLGRIINNLLDISKIEAGKVDLRRSKVDLNEIVEQIMVLFQTRMESKQLYFKKNFSAEAQFIFVDRDKLTQVFTNLIGNAYKFTEKGGIEIGIKEEDDSYVCYVQDTGTGISKENLKKVFGKFQQLGNEQGPCEKGTGLGLSIAQAIVELHKGKIWVESEERRGTRFSFNLPKLTERKVFDEYLTSELKEMMSEHPSVELLSFRWPSILIEAILDKEQKNAGALDRALNRYQKQCWAKGEGKILWTDKHLYLLIAESCSLELKDFGNDLFKFLYAEFSETDSEVDNIIPLCSLNYPEDGTTEEELIKQLYAA